MENFTIKEFCELSENEILSVDGGLLAGALAGAILGGTAGLVVMTGKGIVTGSLTGNEIWKGYTTGALAGAAIGAYTPI